MRSGRIGILLQVLTCILLSTSCEKKTSLVEVENLDSYDWKDDVEVLSEYKNNEKIVKSIKVDRNEILLNRKGVPVCSKSNYGSTEYYFFDRNGRRFLEVYVGDNKYDTIYTYRKYDANKHMCDEIRYNIKRKELRSYRHKEIISPNDKRLVVKEVSYHEDLDSRLPMPFLVSETHMELTEDAEVVVEDRWFPVSDSSEVRNKRKRYHLKEMKLIPADVKYKYDQSGNWIEKNGNSFTQKREFAFYHENEPDVSGDFRYDKNVLLQLDSMIKVLPSVAWANFRNIYEAKANRERIFEKGEYGKRIDLVEADSIGAFTPILWQLVSMKSGYVNGLDSICCVVGYNTPIKNADDFNCRCLAVFERLNGKYVLRKQSLQAIEEFVDQDDDLSFEGIDETNFSVNIEGGEVVVDYEYMRGEASYSYGLKNGAWVLTTYSSSHRTCCEAESYSYDYSKKEYSFSVFSTSEEEGRDTSYTIHQDRPIVYMDSMNVAKFDYNETGLLVK